MKRNRSKAFIAFGTINSIVIPYCENEYCLEQIKRRSMDLNDRLSVYNNTSEISKINTAAGSHYVRVHKDTLNIIKASLAFSIFSQGAFDISIRPLTELWHINKQSTCIPSAQLVAQALDQVGYQDILIDEDNSAVMLKSPPQALDLGSIAKGFAADEALRIIKEFGVTEALINFGGTIVSWGSPHTIGIQHPDKTRGIPMGKLLIQDKAVVTSGIYEQFFTNGNAIYHHIIDPFTGYPANTDLISVTLIGESAMELDALSTAVMVLGMEKGMQLIRLASREKNYQIEAVFITRKNNVYLTPGLKDKFMINQRQVI
jgi:FAD:protein FMN transferase